MLKNHDSLVLELSDCFITPGSPRQAVLSITAESGSVHTTVFHVLLDGSCSHSLTDRRK